MSSTCVADVSSTESNALMIPRFSATNARPSEANRTVVGIVRDEKTVVSVKWAIGERARGRGRGRLDEMGDGGDHDRGGGQRGRKPERKRRGGATSGQKMSA